MRILVLTDLFPPVSFGGYELECAALVDRLRARHEVLVLTTDLERDRAPQEDGVRRTLPFAGGSRRRAVAFAPVAAVRGAIETRRVLAAFRPELVYVSNGVSMPQAAIAIAARGGAPVVCRFAELFFAANFLRGDRFLRHLWPGDHGPRAVWGRAMRLVNHLRPLRIDPTARIPAAISWGSASMREEVGQPELIDPVVERVIHPGTPNAAAFAAVERRPASAPRVAYVGRVTIAKGAETAVRALARLRAEHGLGARLVFAGTCRPPVRAQLERVIAENGVGGHVEFLGHLPAEGVADVLATAGVVVVPSLEHESFGLVALEAALAGVPVVASRVGGLPEGLREGDHALYFSPGDADGCADAIAAVFDRPDDAAARAARARERALEFTLESYLDRSEELIADVA